MHSGYAPNVIPSEDGSVETRKHSTKSSWHEENDFLGFCNRNIVFVDEKCHDKVTVKAPDISAAEMTTIFQSYDLTLRDV